MNCSYNPHKATMNKPLADKYERVLILANFHLCIDKPNMSSFFEASNLKSLILW